MATMVQRVSTLLAGLILCLCICWSAGRAAAGDACNVKAGDLLTFDQTIECVTSVPFLEEVKRDTLASVNKTLPMYVFKYASMQSPDPLIPLNFDIQGAIEEIAKQNASSYESDWDFHHDVFAAFRNLIDGHAVYLMPSCYSKFTLVQPFQVVSYYSPALQRQVLEIAGISNIPGIVDFYLQLGWNITQYVGYQITHMFAMDAIQYVTLFADQSGGGYKDVGTRFNNAIASQLCARQLHRADIPEYEVFAWQLNMDGSGMLINVPWIGVASATFANKSDFAAVCHGKPTNRVANTEFQLDPEEEIRRMLVGDSAPSVPFHHLSGDSTFVQLVKGDSVNFFQKVNSTVGVLQVQSFAPKDAAQFVRDVQNSLFYAQLNKLDKLLVDLTNNGGGEICLGYALTKYLFPVEFQSDYRMLFGRTDMIQNELGKQIAEAAASSNITYDDAMWVPNFWRDDNGTAFSDASWFTHGVKHNHGGVEAFYSSLFKEGYCDDIFSGLNFANNTENLPGQSKYAYTPDDIVLLSNGRCASTCSLFSKRLQQDRRAKTLVVGGIYGRDQMFSGVPGGQVYNLEALRADLAMYSLLDSPYTPPKLPTPSVLSFTIREAYAWRDDLPDRPLEFLYEPAHFRIPYTRQSATDISRVWLDAIQFFNVCTPSIVPRSCKVDGGIGQFHCDATTGRYSDVCEVAACNPGFEYVKDAKQCSPCKEGTFKSETDLSSCKPCTNKPTWSHWDASGSGATSDACAFVCDSGFALHQETKTCAAIEGDVAAVAKYGIGAAAGFLVGAVVTLLIALTVSVLVFLLAINPKLKSAKASNFERQPLIVNRN